MHIVSVKIDRGQHQGISNKTTTTSNEGNAPVLAEVDRVDELGVARDFADGGPGVPHDGRRKDLLALAAHDNAAAIRGPCNVWRMR